MQMSYLWQENNKCPLHFKQIKQEGKKIEEKSHKYDK